MAGSQGSEVDTEWGNLVKELAEYHRRAEEELHQQHWEEIKCAGLNPDGLTLKDGTLFSPEEIRQHLASLGAHLQKADSVHETTVSWGRRKRGIATCLLLGQLLSSLLQSVPSKPCARPTVVGH